MTARYSIEKKKIPASIKTGQDFHPKFRLQPLLCQQPRYSSFFCACTYFRCISISANQKPIYSCVKYAKYPCFIIDILYACMYNMGMKNADLVFAGHDQRSYYNAVQLALPLSTMIRVPHSDMLFSFLDAVKGVNFSRFVKPIRSNNTHSHSRGMLVKVLLFAYMNRFFP